ncbi:hypothetical protein MN186_00195 [Aliiroseovarius sp. N1F302]|nr:hypothetical protein [Aliiroseovarius sediminis]MCI2392902.1 hypothetical protein [Aliiroseovarius sediminis]
MIRALFDLSHRIWAVLVGAGLQTAIKRNEHAAADLDAAVREVLQK